MSYHNISALRRHTIKSAFSHAKSAFYYVNVSSIKSVLLGNCFCRRIMPPKVAQPVVVEVKNITISLIVIKRIVENGSETVISPRGPGKSNIRCRVISFWAENCLTTPIIGGDGFQWTLQEEEKKYLASYEYKFDAEFPTNEDLKNFHQDPGIYFFFQTVQDTTLKPLDLLYIDCSMLLLESTTVSSERLLGTDYEVIVKVNNLKPLKPMPDLLPLEPIVLSMK